MISSQAVGELLTAYWFEVDHRGGVDAHLFFTEDGELSFDAAHFHGRDEIRDVYRTRAARGPRTSRHVVTNVHVVRTDEAIDVVSIMTLYAQDGMHANDGVAPAARVVPVAISDVVDTLVASDGRIFIKRRAIKSQFVNRDAEFAVPTQAQSPLTADDR